MEEINYPDNPIDFIKQYSFSDKLGIYTNGSTLISVFRVGQMIEHYMPGLDPQKIKNIQFCLREKTRECRELRREIQELKNKKSGSWVLADEQLPEEGEKVLVWYEYFRYGDYNRMYETYGIGYQYDGNWSGDVSGTKARCIAWRPLPEPYRVKQPEICKYTGGSCCWPIDQCGECPNHLEER